MAENSIQQGGFRLSYVIDGSPITQVFRSPRVVMGRSHRCDLSLPGLEYVSRRHAKIERERGGWVIVDLQSTNGTYVNGLRVYHHLLQAGDLITHGGTAMSPVVFKFTPLAEGEEEEAK